MKTQSLDSSSSLPGAVSFGWQDRLAQSGSAEEIVAVAREYLARITPEEYSNLPPECRPRKIVDADDVVDYAVTLVRGSCEAGNASDAVLQHLAGFFTDACTRLSQVNSALTHASTAQ